jgi:predicted RNA-binding Zn-ribbon protein involved in translation (DUF1610 family)
MRKAFIVFLALAIVCLCFASCPNEVTYCPNCGSSDIKKLDTVEFNGKTFQAYECHNCFSGTYLFYIAKI